MEKVEMMQRSFENYLRVKQGKITVDITLADGKRIEGIRRMNEKSCRRRRGARGIWIGEGEEAEGMTREERGGRQLKC